MAYVIAPLDPQIDPADAAMVERRSLAVAPAAIAASGSSDSFYVGDKSTLRATQTCTAVSGTAPTLDTTVMTCDTKDGTYYSAGTFTQLTAAAAQRKSFAVDRWVRFDWVVGGSSTPTITSGITAEAV